MRTDKTNCCFTFPQREQVFEEGIEAVDEHELAAIPGRLVGEVATELAESSVREGFRKVAVTDHPGDVQVLEREPCRPRRRCE